jgi:aspartate/methionine/tyrosine aminotransferase
MVNSMNSTNDDTAATEARPQGSVHAVEPGATDKVPPAVADEEAFLDAVVSHVDEDPAGLEQLRDKVSEWYDGCDGVSRKPAPDQ